MTHKHILASGWSRGRQVFRECVDCRQVFKQYGTNKRIEKVKSDYTYYRQMAEYYGIK